jgi:hypothetical protein
VEGVVVCPRGTFSPWTDCLGCHVLEAADGDRLFERSCSTERALDPAEPQYASPIASWGALMIELL